MKFQLSPPYFVFCIMLICSGIASGRTWTESKTGRTLKGDFQSLANDVVTIQRDGGGTVKIPLSRLSSADQEFAKAAPTAAPGGSAASWPTWRGADRMDRSPDSGLLKSWPKDGPKLLWTFTDGGRGYSSPAIVGEHLYFTGTRDKEAELICLDRGTGKELWSTEIGDDPGKGYNTGWGQGPRGGPTVSEGLVYAMSANGALIAVKTADGSKAWSKQLVEDFGGEVPKWGYSESPLVDGDKLLVTPGGDQGAIIALDKKTGKTLWRSKDLTDGAEYSSLIIAEVKGKRQYVQLFMKKLAGISAEDGALLWTADWPEGRTAVIPTPIYHDGKVYMTSGYGAGSMLVDIEGSKAKEVWKNKVMKNHHGGVLLVDGSLYGFSDGGGLTCQDFKTGERIWNEKGEGIQKGAVHYADGMLYGLDEHEGSVFLAEASPKGYKEHGRFSLPKTTKLREGTNGKVWTHPVVLDGHLYLRDQDLVFCYEVKK